MKKITFAGIISLFIISCVSTPPEIIITDTEETDSVVETQPPPEIEKPVLETTEPVKKETEITYSHKEVQTGRVFSNIYAQTFENDDNTFYDFYSEYNPLNYLLGWNGNDLTYSLAENKGRKIGKDKIISLVIYASGFNYTEIVLTDIKDNSVFKYPLLLQENTWNEIMIPMVNFKGDHEFKTGLYNVAVTVPFNANYRMGHLLDESEKGLLCFDLIIKDESEYNIVTNSSLIDLPDRDFIIHDMATGERELILPESAGTVNFNLEISEDNNLSSTKFTINTLPRSTEGFLKINIKTMQNNHPVYWRSDLSPVKALKTDNEDKYVYSLSEVNTWMLWDEPPETQLELMFSYKANEILNFSIETKPCKED